MCLISDEQKNKNFLLYKKKLNEIGIDTSSFDERLGDKLLNCPYGLKESTNGAFDGAMIHFVLRTLTPYAIKINSLLPTNLQQPQESIIKTCLLSQLAKCEMIEPNDNEWEIEKRGILYKWSESQVALKMGLKSIILAQELGVNFSIQEIEAITNMERQDDEQVKFFSSPLFIILKQATELTNLEIKNLKNKNE